MSAFAIVHHPDHLTRFCRDFNGVIACRRGPQPAPAERLLGIWLEHRTLGSRVSWMTGADWMAVEDEMPAVADRELAGIWSLYRVPSPRTSRRAVLDALARLPGQGIGRTASRFVPVFPSADDLAAHDGEWAALAARHPGLVLPPIVQEGDGILRLDDIGWAYRQIGVAPGSMRSLAADA